MHNFRKIKAWEEAIELSVLVYSITQNFPESEKFGLSSQIRRCSVSIASNIAEGAGRETSAQFAYFLSVSLGSGNELLSQLLLSYRLGFISQEDLEKIEDKIDKVQRMIIKFKKQL